ncbi:MAG: hypothetical protein M4579_004103 [Chaenotheca gracillima]|nr:MAG: hypothetical protein M4579_004103 [Chaenotheca gracillima]
MTDIRSSSNHPHMPPPSRSPANPTPVSPQKSIREDYITATPHILRHPRPPRSPVDLISGSNHSSLISTPRSLIGPPGSASSSSSGHPYRHSIDGSALDATPHALGQNAAVVVSPPLYDTQDIHQIRASNGQSVHAIIDAHIDKGFFLADQEWTCYRRNYFSVACSYKLAPPMAPGPLYLRRSGSNDAEPEPITSFAMSISAVVDATEGKPIDLVQHTPKRDKGPQGKPDRITLSPYSPGSMGMYPSGTPLSNSLMSDPRGARHREYDPTYVPPGTQPQTVANFERIQFKSATANNGKRRAAQQYYNLIVELYANVTNSMGENPKLVKIATRMSASMVVRGRSPGHYQEDRRASPSSAGPGGTSGRDGNRGPAGGPGGLSGARSLGDPMSLMSGSSSMLGSGGYQGSNGISSLHQSPSSMESHTLSSRSSSGGHLDNQMDPNMPPEENHNMDEPPYNQYYPPALYESDNSHSRSTQNNLRPYMSSNYSDDRNGGNSHQGGDYVSAQMMRPEHDSRRMAREDYPGSFNLPQPSLLRYGSNGANNNGGVGTNGNTSSSGFSGKDYPRNDVFRSSCGRYQGPETTRGHYSDLPAL